MSNFTAPTKHPTTSKEEQAEWMDNYFGRRRYGVRFPSDGSIWREERNGTLTRMEDDRG